MNSLLKGGRELMARSMGDALSGGLLRVYGGRRRGESSLLCELVFPDKYELVAKDGDDLALQWGAFAMSKCLAMGDATWFRAFAKGTNSPMLEGSAGQHGQLQMDSERLYQGMELNLDGFEHVLNFTEEE